jgi:hypothetical protein
MRTTKRQSGIMVLLALAAAMMFTTCEMSKGSFDYNLWGTWVSKDHPDDSLVITFNSIKIFGDPDFSYYGYNYPTGILLDSYSEKISDTENGNIYIKWQGEWKEQPYIYSKTGSTEWLHLKYKYYGQDKLEDFYKD